jgi:hypothetical protein
LTSVALLVDCCLRIAFLLVALTMPARAALVVATVGDSFADALYLAMKVRPTMLSSRGIELVRWSRANIGFTRLDFFDYPGWLRDNPSLGRADLCIVHIGSNDLQSIRTGKWEWAAFGSAKWRTLYAERTSALLETLQKRRCGRIIWVLQPKFEKSPRMSSGAFAVSQVQASVLALRSVPAFDVVTSPDDYQEDNIHYGRSLMLRMGPALIRIADSIAAALGKPCESCHLAPDVLYRGQDLLPLRLHGH